MSFCSSNAKCPRNRVPLTRSGVPLTRGDEAMWLFINYLPSPCVIATFCIRFLHFARILRLGLNGKSTGFSWEWAFHALRIGFDVKAFSKFAPTSARVGRSVACLSLYPDLRPQGIRIRVDIPVPEVIIKVGVICKSLLINSLATSLWQFNTQGKALTIW